MADPDGQLSEQHDPETHLIPLALLAAVGRRGALGIFGLDDDTPDGTSTRDDIHVADPARAAQVLGFRTERSGIDQIITDAAPWFELETACARAV